MNKNENILQSEKELIYLLLHHKNAIEDFLSSGLTFQDFSDEYQSVVKMIIDYYEKEKGKLLTRKAFNSFIRNALSPKDKIAKELAFNECCATNANINDIPILINKILEERIQESLNQSLTNFANNKSKKGNIYAIRQLSDDCQKILEGARHDGGDKTYYGDIRGLSSERIQYVEDVRSGKIVEKPPVLTGIREIDYTMVTGLEPGTLTLITAEVGCYKSTMMLNIGLNVWKAGYNVLLVPIEMEKDQMLRRAWAREARIPFSKLTKNLKDLSQENADKLHAMQKAWEGYSSKLFIMQSFGSTTVKNIERQVRENAEIMKPDLLIIDYVANLVPDKSREGRNDLEIGDMLKSMRQMGKDMKFAVISGAQIGRKALERNRRAGQNSNKPLFNSEDIRGSHEYSADADNIYAQTRSLSQPNQILELYVIKARNGTTSFEDGSSRALLRINPEIGLIQSIKDEEEMFNNMEDDILDLVDKTEEDVKKNDGNFVEIEDDIFDYEDTKKVDTEDTSDIEQMIEDRDDDSEDINKW